MCTPFSHLYSYQQSGQTPYAPLDQQGENSDRHGRSQ